MNKLFTGLLLALVVICGAVAQGTTYTTSFGATENPISEAGHWVNGQAVGLDWKDVQTTPGLAFGADTSGVPHYNDPTAILTGTWGPTQTVQATVHSVNQQTGNVYEEVEIRLRSAITAHGITGYEINFRCNHDAATWYTDIVRWNGPLGNFTFLSHLTSGPGISDGDVVKATIVGGVITVFINGKQVNQATDNTFTTGNPGIGFYLDGAAGLNADYGFTSFTATDGPGTPPSAPTNLRVIK
jgi:hypothetical protein